MSSDEETEVAEVELLQRLILKVLDLHPDPGRSFDEMCEILKRWEPPRIALALRKLCEEQQVAGHDDGSAKNWRRTNLRKFRPGSRRHSLRLI